MFKPQKLTSENYTKDEFDKMQKNLEGEKGELIKQKVNIQMKLSKLKRSQDANELKEELARVNEGIQKLDKTLEHVRTLILNQAHNQIKKDAGKINKQVGPQKNKYSTGSGL